MGSRLTPKSDEGAPSAKRLTGEGSTMGDAQKKIGPIGRQLQALAKGSLTVGYQTAIIEAMACIDDVMQERGVSRKELADKMQVDPSRITRLLNDPDNITIKTFYRLCNALNLKPSICVDRGPWLMKGDEWTTAQPGGSSLKSTDREAGESVEREGPLAA